jgi:hypothetical protein
MAGAAKESVLRIYRADALSWSRSAWWFSVAHDRPDSKEAHGPGRVLRFQLRRRASPQRPRGSAATPDGSGTEPIDALAQYEDEDRNVDYRHRMLMNVIAVMIVVLLIGAGVWMADTIADMQKVQDCAMQGRQNCAPIEVAIPARH